MASSIGPGRMPQFADVPLGAALRVKTSAHVRYAMGFELDADVYDYDAGGDDGCPLLVLTPVSYAGFIKFYLFKSRTRRVEVITIQFVNPI